MGVKLYDTNCGEDRFTVDRLRRINKFICVFFFFFFKLLLLLLYRIGLFGIDRSFENILIVMIIFNG